MENNPWHGNPIYTKTGGLDLILSVHNKITNNDKNTSIAPNIDKYSSIQLINILKEISGLNEEFLEKSSRKEWNKLYNDFHNILDTDVLDRLLSMIENLSKHFQEIIENKDRLVEHLHKPHLGDYIAVDSSHHEEICSFYPLIASNLADLSQILKNFEWFYKFSVKSSMLKQTLESISSSSDLLQSNSKMVKESRDLMNEIARLHK